MSPPRGMDPTTHRTMSYISLLTDIIDYTVMLHLTPLGWNELVRYGRTRTILVSMFTEQDHKMCQFCMGNDGRIFFYYNNKLKKRMKNTIYQNVLQKYNKIIIL